MQPKQPRFYLPVILHSGFIRHILAIEASEDVFGLAKAIVVLVIW
jgi:hypothetical protein